MNVFGGGPGRRYPARCWDLLQRLLGREKGGSSAGRADRYFHILFEDISTDDAGLEPCLSIWFSSSVRGG